MAGNSETARHEPWHPLEVGVSWVGRTWQNLTTVHTSDAENARLGRLFNTLMVIGLLIVIILSIVLLLLEPLGYVSRRISWTAAAFPMAFVPLAIFCLVRARRGHVRPMIRLYLSVNLLAIGAACGLFDGIHSPAWVLFFWSVSIGGILLAPASALWLSAGVLAYYFLLLAATHAGLYTPPLSLSVPGREYVNISATLLVLISAVGLLTYLNMRSQQEALALLRNEIEARKQTEASLKNMAEKFRTIFESSFDAIMLYDQRGFLDSNPAALRMFGCATRDDLVHKHPVQFSARTQPGGLDSRQLIQEYFDLALRQGSHRFEWLLRRLDGTQFVSDILLTAMELEGKPVMLATLRDITERKETETAVRKARDLLQSVVEHVPARIFWKDRDSRYLGCNAQFAQDAGLAAPEQLIGKTDFDMGWRDQAELYRADDKATMESGIPKLDYEEPQATPDGHLIWLRTSKVPLRDEHGQVFGILGLYQDVTEQKRLADTLRENEERLDLALRAAGMGVWELDLADSKRHFDNQACYLLGIDPEAFGGTPDEFFRTMHPEDRESIKAALIRTVEQDVPYEPDYRAVWPDGSIHYITARARLVRDDRGRPMRVRGIIWNISERKRSEQALREREDMLSKITNSAQDAILILDHEGNIALWNKAAEGIFGYTGEEALGKNLHMLLAPARFHENYLARFPRFAVTGEGPVVGKTLELTAVRKDGSEFPMELSLSAVKLREHWHAVGIVRDITERRKSEAGLKLFRTLLDQSGEAIEVVDPQTLRFVDVNQRACTDLGYAREELLSLGPSDIDSTLNRDQLSGLVQDLARQGSLTIEGRHRRKDGTEFPVEVGLSYVKLDRDYVLAIARDIAARKLGEAALARANRALRTLSASNMALVRGSDEAALLESVCRLIVEIGGYRMVWVGYAEQDPAKTLRPVTHHGHEDGYLATAKLSWADDAFGRNPFGAAIRSGQVQISRIAHDAPPAWRNAAQQRGYASSIALPLANGAGAIGVLVIYASESDAFDENEVKLLQELAGDLAFGIETLRTRADRDRIAFENLHHSEILRQSLEDSIKAIASTVEMRDPYTAGHQRRVGQLSVAIARELGLPESTIHGLDLAASIHDLGKISVPAEILSKPGKLTELEIMLLRNHPRAGYDILKDIRFPWPIAAMVLQHHERLDGSGYPDRLQDDAILLESRILAVADVVEAMASHRPYRPSLGIDRALAEIREGRGTTYDADVVDACARLFEEKRFEFSG